MALVLRTVLVLVLDVDTADITTLTQVTCIDTWYSYEYLRTVLEYGYERTCINDPSDARVRVRVIRVHKEFDIERSVRYRYQTGAYGGHVRYRGQTEVRMYCTVRVSCVESCFGAFVVP